MFLANTIESENEVLLKKHDACLYFMFNQAFPCVTSWRDDSGSFKENHVSFSKLISKSKLPKFLN